MLALRPLDHVLAWFLDIERRLMREKVASPCCLSRLAFESRVSLFMIRRDDSAESGLLLHRVAVVRVRDARSLEVQQIVAPRVTVKGEERSDLSETLLIKPDLECAEELSDGQILGAAVGRVEQSLRGMKQRDRRCGRGRVSGQERRSRGSLVCRRWSKRRRSVRPGGSTDAPRSLCRSGSRYRAHLELRLWTERGRAGPRYVDRDLRRTTPPLCKSSIIKMGRRRLQPAIDQHFRR